MKITDVRTLCLSRKHEPELIWFSSEFRAFKADCPIVIIETDGGLQGISEPSTYGDPPALKSRAEELKYQLIGEDPEDPSLVPENTGDDLGDIYNAGIELALWDIRGKIAGKRVADLILDELPGPRRQPHERLRLYASAGVQYDWNGNPESVIDEAIGLADRGYTAYKMRLGTAWHWSDITVERFLELAQGVTDAVGDRMELMLEGNARLDEDQALQIGRWLDERGWTWFEEPLPKDQIDGYARLNKALDIPITGGEANTRLDDFEPFFKKHAYARGQLDVGMCTLREALRIYERGREYGIPVFTQNWHNGLLSVCNAHFLAALPEMHVLEQFVGQGPLQWDILRESPIDSGYFNLPAGAGWGVELADDLEEQFPWIPGSWGEHEER
jgi:L-alanine-DL-glutamate epimerase-like enolase superfamily enzyme